MGKLEGFLGLRSGCLKFSASERLKAFTAKNFRDARELPASLAPCATLGREYASAGSASRLSSLLVVAWLLPRLPALIIAAIHIQNKTRPFPNVLWIRAGIISFLKAPLCKGSWQPKAD